MIGIYKITSPSNRVYIGQSIDIEFRWRGHIWTFTREDFDSRLKRSVKKHGIESHIFEILEECEIDQLNKRERYWQDFYDVLGPKGLNSVLNDSEELPRIYSKEVRDRMSASQLGKVQSKETIEKRILKTRNPSDKTRRQMSLVKLGKKKSAETRDRMSVCKEGSKNPSAKKIINSTTGEIFDTIKDAAESINEESYYLYSRLNGKVKNKTNFKHYEE